MSNFICGWTDHCHVEATGELEVIGAPADVRAQCNHDAVMRAPWPAPFPGHQYRLDWRRAEGGGNWYYSPELDMEGWLCPALFRYFSDAPASLYAQIKARA